MFCLLIITVRAIAQKPVDIVKKYINDTTGFALIRMLFYWTVSSLLKHIKV